MEPRAELQEFSEVKAQPFVYGELSDYSAISPSVAVVVPVYRHSVLVSEALWSALEQDADFEYSIVAVNDGCPSPETHAVLMEFGKTFPGKIWYIRQRNKGLSAARNTGVDFVLEHWPTIRAVYFLDADNRILRLALRKALSVLDAHPEVSWVFPSIDMFSLEANYDHGGPYSRLCHLSQNVSEAGSMVHRRVFDAGVRFDENMKIGFEDWDFWLQAIEHGFRGKCLPELGFEYRQRPESMLSGAKRHDALLRQYLRQKHKRLYSAATAVRFEHEEAPRYAIFGHPQQNVTLTSDPLKTSEQITVNEAGERLLRTFYCSSRSVFPPFIVFPCAQCFKSPNVRQLLRWILWFLELRARDYNFLAVRILQSETESELSFRTEESTSISNPLLEADLIFVQTMTLKKIIQGKNVEWFHSLNSSAPETSILCLELKLPDERSRQKTSILDRLLEFVNEVRKHNELEQLPLSWSWRRRVLPIPDEYFEIVRDIADGNPVFPYVKSGAKDLGIVLPIMSFGGVEKVALNIARVFRSHGWQIHIFVTSGTWITLLPALTEVADTISFFSDKTGIEHANGRRIPGMNLSNWAEHGDHRQTLGLTRFLDAVINFHSIAFAGLLGELRRGGTLTIANLALHDLTPLGRPTGHPYITLAYEHVYDIVTICWRGLRDWCHALGIPQDKLVHLPNAPSFEISAEERKQALLRRQERPLNEPLRILFLGRFDRQKGIERLVELKLCLDQKELDIEWRFVGRAVVDHKRDDELTKRLGQPVEPPFLYSNKIKEGLLWADIFILLSRYEGAPLALMEAMALGTVPIATAVGGVAEIINHQKTGLLIQAIDDREVVRSASDFILELEGDRSKLLKLAEAAIQASSRWNWEQNTGELFRRVEAAVSSR